MNRTASLFNIDANSELTPIIRDMLVDKRGLGNRAETNAK